MRLRALPFLLVFLAVGVVLTTPAPPTDARPATTAPDIDSARAEMEIGRHWHAARHLRDLWEGGREFGPEEILLLARAEAGYRNWEGVAELLEGAAWLDDEGDGLGWRLLARAREAGEAWDDAAEAYERYLATDHGQATVDRPAVRARRAAALARAGHGGESLDVIDAIGAIGGAEGGAGGTGVIASWVALAAAADAAERGDTADVRRLLARVQDPPARERTWELGARARLAAGDTAGAVAAYRELSEGGASSARRGVALALLGDIALARGDTAGATRAYLELVSVAPTSPRAIRPARRLLDLADLPGLPDATLLSLARILDRAGESGPALRAYDRYVERVGAEAAGEDVRLAYARLLAGQSDRRAEAVPHFRALSTSDDADVGAAALEAWADLRRRQGRTADVDTLRAWLVERYPSSPQAVQHVFLRGDAAHDRMELDAALADYGRLQEMAPEQDRAGLARMRAAQIHLLRDEPTRALEVYRSYRDEFPEGRRWDQATYWSGRILREQGRVEEGNALLREVIERDPLSYYAVLAGEALERPFRPLGGDDAGAAGAGGGIVPAWIEEELVLLRLLDVAGLDDARAVRVESAVDRALAAGGEAALRMAEGLIEQGLTIEGVNLGWALREQGMEWSPRLLRVTYPFPYREMVQRAAVERDLDPILVASLIRQESAFDHDIRSSAGAVGLMQIMPETGRNLAASAGPEDFTVESLETPEINLHLGTLYVRELLDRFDGELPFVLSGYNAGPNRARDWRAFPEADDPLRFTERIPYGETRDYVKRIRRNLAIYEMLYGAAVRSSEHGA